MFVCKRKEHKLCVMSSLKENNKKQSKLKVTA